VATTTTDAALAARAKAADAAMFERAAERVEALDGATALHHPGLPRVIYLNALRLEAPLDADAAEALAERVQGGLPHRRLEVADEAAGEKLAAVLAGRGWDVGRLLLLGRDGQAPPPEAAKVAEEVPYGHVRGLRSEWIRSEPWAAGDEDLIGQVLAADALLLTATPTRAFAVFEDGRAVAYCLLLEAGGGAGLVEDVYTTPEARGRGLAAAVVAHALGAARAEGHDAVFIPTDAGGRARALYERLGFRPLGIVHQFLRFPK
jgi:GNAT superfamily N-acetyltransferase